MEDNSSSDDEEVTAVKKHILIQNESKSNKKKKENPPQVPLSAENVIDFVNPTLAIIASQDPVENAFMQGKKYKENMHFPWLDTVGPTCHSVKQLKSGADVSMLKKKYRNMRCTTCAQYNPATPWASLWPRKFELQTLRDHNKSGAHVKSESTRQQALGIDESAAGGEGEGGAGASSSSGSNAASAIKFERHGKAAALSADGHGAAGLDFNEDDGDTEGGEEEEGGAGEESMGGAGSARFRGRIRGATLGSSSMTLPMVGGSSAINNGPTHSTRVRPEWLFSEGALCLSDKQASDPTLPPSTKKKYKMMACHYCKEFLPDCQWAQVRPRKFESAVLTDHERSACHQKALDIRGCSFSAQAQASADVEVLH